MVSVGKITDQESLTTWLKGRPREFAVPMAHRSAMRVVPLNWVAITERTAKSDLKELAVLRCCLISGVSGRWASQELRAAAEAAEAAGTVEAAADAADAAAAAAAFDAVANPAAANAAVYAETATASAFADVASATTWRAINRDVMLLEEGEALDVQPLWHGDGNPLVWQWVNTRTAWQARGPGWRFWIDWYEDALAGRPPNWDVLKEIALIDPDDWDRAPDHVNALIADIRIKHAVKDTPNAEVVSLNEATGRLRVDPITEMPPDHLAEAVEKLQSILTLFDLGSALSNQFRPVEEERGIIQKAASEYAARPRLLHSACVRVVKRLNIKIANGECPKPEKDANIADFYGTVAEVSADLFERDPLVKEAATAKGTRKLPDATGDAAATLVNAADEVAEASEGDLAAELPEQARAATDAAATQFERKEAFYVLASRLLRVWLITGYRAGKGTLEEIEALSRTTAGICKNAAVIGGSGAVLSSPVWLQPAVQYILSLM